MSPSIYDATLGGVDVHTKVGASIQAASERIAIDEAPTVTLTLLDPDRALLERADLWNQPQEAPLQFVLGERAYGFVQLDKQAHRVLKATFESMVSLRLRNQQGFRKAYRSRITRLAFCQSLCREAGVKFHAPEAGPLAPEFRPASGSGTQQGGGFEKGSRITVRGAPASAAQLAAIETVLGEVFAEHAPERAAIAVVMTVTQESTWNPKAGLKPTPPTRGGFGGGGDFPRPGDHVGLFQQDPAFYPAPLDEVVATREFLKRFLPVYRANLSSSLGSLIESVQRAGLGSQPYDQWEAEASTTVAAFTRPGAHRTLLLNDKFEFSRGQPHRPETSWDALGRILSEIGWRRFVIGDTLWAASDEWLFATPARAVLIEDTGAVEDITWSLDAGKAIDRATVTVDDSWVFSPGVVVRLEQEGPASGKWLLATWERDLLRPSGTLELVKPGRTIPEPVGDQTGKGYKPSDAPPPSSKDAQDAAGVGEAVVAWALPYAKLPATPSDYVWGAKHGVSLADIQKTPRPKPPFDCSSFVRWAWGAVTRIDIAAGGGNDATYGEIAAAKTTPGVQTGTGVPPGGCKAGDVLFFSNGGHVALAVNATELVNAKGHEYGIVRESIAWHGPIFFWARWQDYAFNLKRVAG